MNTQPIEKRQITDGSSLEVHSIFYTIQGEGPFTGHPAIFIRLAGCNLQCPGCDTDYTSNRDVLTVREILAAVSMHMPDTVQYKLAVITGGEPFRQNITPLVNALFDADYGVQIETNGTLPPSPRLHGDAMIVCSPKTGKINPELEARLDALKYVAKAGDILSDGLPGHALDHTAEPCVARPPKEFYGVIYLQPMDEKSHLRNAANLGAVRDACMTHGHTLQLQVHKIVGVE